MSSAPARRHRTAALVVVLLALAAAGLAIWAGPVGGLGYPAVEAAIAEARGLHDQRLRDRPPAVGEGVAGSAFACYRLADLMVGDDRFYWHDELQQLVRSDLACIPSKAHWRERWQPVLQWLSAGARRRDARGSWLPNEHLIGRIAQTELLWLLAEGDTAAAVRLFLDLGTFLLDGGWQTPGASDWSDRQLERLPAADARLLADGVLRLEARIDPPPAVLEYFLGMEQVLAGTIEWGSHEVWAAWRYGFDPDARYLAGFDALLTCRPLFESAAGPWPDRLEQFRALRDRLRALGHEEWAEELEWVAERERDRRVHLGELRLLRLAIAFLQQQPVPDVRDPLTCEPMARTIDGDTAEFWFGHDGRESRRRVTR